VLVTVGVSVAVGVSVPVTVAASVLVAVAVGVPLAVGIGVFVGGAVEVNVGVGVFALEGVAVPVPVNAAVGVFVGVTALVLVNVAKAVVVCEGTGVAERMGAVVGVLVDAAMWVDVDVGVFGVVGVGFDSSLQAPSVSSAAAATRWRSSMCSPYRVRTSAARSDEGDACTVLQGLASSSRRLSTGGVAVRFDERERAHYARDGFVLRAAVFPQADLDRLRLAVEETVAAVVVQARRPDSGPEFLLAGHRLQFSSRTVIQWEWRDGSPEVRLLEPFTHLDGRFAGLWNDPRLVEPMRDALGADGVAPFTCKLNLKRPHDGSEFPWHQDYPYWYARTKDGAHEIATAMIFLDAASAANGALRVLPGSHRAGPAPRDRVETTGFLADAARIDASQEELVPAPAGSVLFFPSLLLHRSSPNTSADQRRAILLSFQPAGRPRQEDLPWNPERVHELP